MASQQAGTSKRKVWKKSEEDALIKVMVEQIADKWTADNGFRAGFFTLLEKELEKLLPGCNIKAQPHIDSKVKYWRKMYAKLYDILNLSGFGWDNVAKRIECEPSVWAAYEAANPKTAKGLNGKSFPYYDQWVVLFGKDRATGEGAEDPAQMAQADPIEEDYNGDFYIPVYEDDFFGGLEVPLGTNPTSQTNETTIPSNASLPTGTTQTTGPPPTPHASLPTGVPRASNPRTSAAPSNAHSQSQKGRKRARLSAEELAVQESMEVWMKETASHMGKMATSMNYDQDLSATRKSVAKEIKKLNLTPDQRFKLSAIITKSEDRVDDFFGQDEDELQHWAEAVLDGNVYDT